MSAKSITTPTVLARTIKRALHGFGIGSEINAHLAPGEEYDTDRVLAIDRPQPDGSVDTFLVTIHRVGVEPQGGTPPELTAQRHADLAYFNYDVREMDPTRRQGLLDSLRRDQALLEAKVNLVRRIVEDPSW